MIRIALILCVSFGCGRGHAGETNTTLGRVGLFLVSATPVQVQTWEQGGEALVSERGGGQGSEPAERDPPKSESEADAASTNSVPTRAGGVTNQVSLTAGEFTKAEAALYERLLQQGYFSRVDSGMESPFAKALDTIFSPDFVHLGQVDVSCTVLTAIRRKDPLYLLNPIFFQMTW